MFSEGLNSIKKILYDTPCGGWIVLSDKIEELSDPIQNGIGPENAISHLLVAAQNTSAGLLMRDHSSRLDGG